MFCVVSFLFIALWCGRGTPALRQNISHLHFHFSIDHWTHGVTGLHTVCVKNRLVVTSIYMNRFW